MNDRLPPRLAALLLSAFFLAAAVPGHAHQRSETRATVDARATPRSEATAEPRAILPEEPHREPSIRADAPRTSALPGIVALFALALVVVVPARRPRHAIAALAVLVLIILAFESGLHSVHHLGDDRGASHCSVASATTHLAGTTGEPASDVAIALPTAERAAVVVSAAPSTRPFRPDAGRAPPPQSFTA